MINLKQKMNSLMGKAKENYRYFRMGLKAEKDEQRRKLIERNRKAMENIRKGQPEENLKLKGWN